MNIIERKKINERNQFLKENGCKHKFVSIYTKPKVKVQARNPIDMRDANLRGADLMCLNLMGANLVSVRAFGEGEALADQQVAKQQASMGQQAAKQQPLIGQQMANIQNRGLIGPW